jgi:hypothetical protein
MSRKRYILDASPFFNHGCNDSAVFEDQGDGTAICVVADSCHSCWQVGHDDSHTFYEVGDIEKVENLISSKYYVEEE